MVWKMAKNIRNASQIKATMYEAAEKLNPIILIYFQCFFQFRFTGDSLQQSLLHKLWILSRYKIMERKLKNIAKHLK